MFKAPTTVAQAMAPFSKVKRDLALVLTKQVAARNAAEKRLNAARTAAAEVEARETANMTKADAESAKAAKLIEKLDALFAADSSE